jgi:hypothetical protein
MIYSRGELVRIVNFICEDNKKFVGYFGRIQKVKSIDNDVFPYVVVFYSGGVKSQSEFNFKELSLIDTFDGEERKQDYNNEIKMFDLQKSSCLGSDGKKTNK